MWTPGKERIASLPGGLYNESGNGGLSGRIAEDRMEEVRKKLADPVQDRFFDETRMYTYVKARAQALGMRQTVLSLPFARKKHQGQVRKFRDYEGDIPYINHPLTMACHAISMGLDDDDVIAALLLHDVVEDTGTSPEELPVNDRVKEAVALVSKNLYDGPKEEWTPRYYAAIAENPLASLVKCIDRCHNVSCMYSGFSKKKQEQYILETERYILPLVSVVKEVPEWNRAAWLLKYQMLALLETYKYLLGEK